MIKMVAVMMVMVIMLVADVVEMLTELEPARVDKDQRKRDSDSNQYQGEQPHGDPYALAEKLPSFSAESGPSLSRMTALSTKRRRANWVPIDFAERSAPAT
jgi:hypothetical protein